MAIVQNNFLAAVEKINNTLGINEKV